MKSEHDPIKKLHKHPNFYYGTDLGVLLKGDCLEILPHLEPVDMTLTDPPYGTTACSWDSVIPFEPMWEQLKRITKKNGAIALFGSQPFASALVMSNLKMFKHEWVWYKSKPSGVAFKTQPMRNHENVLVFAQGKTMFNAIKEEREGFTEGSIKRFSSGENLGSYRNHGNSTTGMGKTKLKKISKLRNPTTIKKFASVPNRLGTFHPTQKPVDWMEYLIKTYTNEGDTVLDFTIGSGTTAVACERLNRRWIGIEIEEKYCEIAAKRIENERKQRKLF